MKRDVWTEKDIEYLQTLQQDTIPLDSLIASELNDGNTELEISQTLASEEPNPEELAIIQCKKEYISSVINKLSPREQIVIRMRFGFETGNPMSLEAIGDKFGLTRERIRQIEEKALLKLKNRLKESELC